MSKKISAKLAQVGGPPEGGFWTWVTSELLTSPAWRVQSIHCRRLIEFLQVEHMAHAGSENGHLLATYDQLVHWGITRRAIHDTISEAERLGLIVVARGGRKKFAETHLTRYRLTFLAERCIDGITGNVYFGAPTNEWKRVTREDAAAIRRNIAGIKNAKQHSEGEPRRFPKGNSDGSRRGTVRAAQMAENCQAPTVPEQEPPYISRLPLRKVAGSADDTPSPSTTSTPSTSSLGTTPPEAARSAVMGQLKAIRTQIEGDFKIGAHFEVIRGGRRAKRSNRRLAP